MEPMYQRDGDGNYIMFSWVPVQNAKATEEEGRPIFDKCLMFEITSPGLTKSTYSSWVERHEYQTEKVIVEPRWARKYADQIKNFKNNVEGGDISGTPLEELPFLHVHIRAMLKAHHIHNAEALAELSEAGIAEVGRGARQWVQQAKVYLEAAQGGAPLTRLVAENEKLTDEVARLNAVVSELGAKFDEMESKRGRKAAA